MVKYLNGILIILGVLGWIILFAIVFDVTDKKSTGTIVIDYSFCDLFVDTLDPVTGWYGKDYYHNKKNWSSIGKIIASTCISDTGLRLVLVGRRLNIGDTIEIEYDEYHATIER